MEFKTQKDFDSFFDSNLRERVKMQEPTSLAAAARSLCPEPEQQSAVAGEQLQCPRCESTNTKFCYYNNYNLAQPRHFCKDCRRYWTKGGSLRDIPVGGGTRRATKRSTPIAANNPPKRRPSPPSPSSQTAAISPVATAMTEPEPEPVAYSYPEASAAGGDNDDHRMLDFSRSLCSLLGTDGTFAQLLDNCFRPCNPTAAGEAAAEESVRCTLSDLGDTPPEQQQNSGESNGNDSTTKPAAVPERLLGYPGETSFWSNTDSGGGAGGRQWPDLTIYTPMFKFQ